jgi:bifunctional non-homologous end joining protein LigD
MEYLTFAGDIPEGEYGAGNMFVWDTGWYDLDKWETKKVVATLHGERARGKYALFELKGRDWMIHRMDPPDDPTRQPVPTDLRPMRGRAGGLPNAEDDWAYEVCWTGLRALVLGSTGAADLVDEDGHDISPAFPEVRRISRALGSVEVVLDSVLVPGAGGRDSIDRRLGARSESTIRRLSRDQPVAAVLFDVLWLDGHAVLDRPWTERRALLDDLGLDGPAWRTPQAHVGEGGELVEAARDRGVGGLVAKRMDSAYQPGKLSPDWIEIAL